jgi:MFS family permease
MNTAPKNALPYYGWFVLAASACSELLVTGASSYAAGLFILPLQAEFGLSRADASSSVLILFLGAIFVSPLAGRVVDRHPIRPVMLTGAALFTGALAVIAIAPALWVMILVLLIPGALGYVVLGPLTTATLASRWFFKRRGLALGIAAVATSGGGLMAPLLAKAIQSHGWRGALLGEAGILFVIIAILALFVLKDNPFRAGYAEHPENRGRDDEAILRDPGRTNTAAAPAFGRWREILGHPGFWAPSLAIATTSGIAQAIVGLVPPYGHQLGFDAQSAAFLITLFSIAAATTKILAGVLADFLDSRIVLFVAALVMPLALAVLYFLASYPALAVAACLAGVALGGVLPSAASLIAARFGAARVGSVMGWSYALLGISLLVTVRFAGTMFDLTGSYRPAFAGLLVFALLLMSIALVIDRRMGAKP